VSQDEIVINARVRVPFSELAFRASRASGPGGQNVNKTESAIELLFDLAHTSALTDDERRRAQGKLAAHVDSDGVMHVESQSERSQLRNREEAIRKFAQLLREALVIPKQRRKTKPTRSSIEARLQTKKRTGDIKRHRRSMTHDA
jgi:ribosome-associated protein